MIAIWVVVASTAADSVKTLRVIQVWLDRILAAQRPAFAFGGLAFNDRPELIDEMPGTFLGETIQSSTDTIERLMMNRKSNQ